MSARTTAFAAMLALAVASTSRSAGLEKQHDGGYRFTNALYEATVNSQGAIGSLKVKGLEMLSLSNFNATAYGIAYVAGPSNRTVQDLPNLTREAGMVVARGEGKEVSYRFLDDGIDFLLDASGGQQWVFHWSKTAITHAQRTSGEVVNILEGHKTLRVLATNGYAIQLNPEFFTMHTWVGTWGSPDSFTASYIPTFPGKSEVKMRFTRHSGLAQQLETTISGARPDHLFPAGQPVKFDVVIDNHHDRDFAGVLKIVVADHAGFEKPQVFERPAQVAAKSKGTITWSEAFRKPLVGRCELSLASGGETVITRDFVFVYDAEHYCPEVTRPVNFQEFWAKALREMRQRPLDLQITPQPQLGNTHMTVATIAFNGIDRRIEGWLVEPTTPGPHAGRVGSRTGDYQWEPAKPEDLAPAEHELTAGRLAVGLTMKTAPTNARYEDGATRPERTEFRQFYCDYVRCIDVLASRPNVDPKRIFVNGASRGGPAAFAAAALDDRVAMVDIHVPTSAGMSWSSGFYRAWGPPLMGAQPGFPTRKEWNDTVLAYFDPVNFAQDIKCPVIIGLGLLDYDLSPSPGIIAMYGSLTGDRALGVAPWERHCLPAAFLELRKRYEAMYLGENQ